MTRPAKINLSAWPIITGTGGMGGISIPPAPPFGNFLTKNEGGQDFIEAHGNTGTTETFDPTDGNVHTATLDDDCTFTLNPPIGTGAATLELYVTQDGVGSHLVTWPGSVVWPGGTAPTLSTAAASVDRIILETLDGGTTWFGVLVGAASNPAITSMWVPVMTEVATDVWYVAVTGDGDAVMTEVPL